MRRAEVALVGGGNSAGQATVYSPPRQKVTLIARRPLDQTMSQYLIDRISSAQHRSIDRMRSLGPRRSRRQSRSGQLAQPPRAGRRAPSGTSSPFIGAEPNTDWLAAGIKLRRAAVHLHR